jgi:hypothetical protein
VRPAVECSAPRLPQGPTAECGWKFWDLADNLRALHAPNGYVGRAQSEVERLLGAGRDVEKPPKERIVFVKTLGFGFLHKKTCSRSERPPARPRMGTTEGVP